MASATMRMEMIGGYEIREFPEAAAQTFKEGQPVKFSSGKLAIHGDNTDLERLIGLPLKDATGTTNSMIPVALFKPGALVRASAYHAVAASAVVSKLTDMGGEAQIVNNANKSVIDVAATFGADSKASFIIIDAEGDSNTEQYRRVVLAIKASHCALYDALPTEA